MRLILPPACLLTAASASAQSERDGWITRRKNTTRRRLTLAGEIIRVLPSRCCAAANVESALLNPSLQARLVVLHGGPASYR